MVCMYVCTEDDGPTLLLSILSTYLPTATGVYKTLKGGMTAVVGDRWYLKESLPDIAWSAPRSIPKDKVGR